MWRNITRGFQENVRRYCLEKPHNIVKDEKISSHSCCVSKLFPSLTQNLNCHVLNQKNENKNDEDNSSGNVRPSQHTFLEAFGWSGALVFGWVISKQLLIQQTWKRDQDLCNKRLPHQTIIQLFTHVVKNQPPSNCILPQAQSDFNVKSSKGCEPLSPNFDDEFETAARELQEIHERAIGEALNRKGIACLSRSTGKEAFKYFERASKLKYPPASFNMGQCCELGIGTEQDFKQAAKWYKIASDQGHSTAMYNLGVFYAHGWGGLDANINSAKELFVKAAHLGQVDAKAALERESKFRSSSNVHCNSSCSNKPIIVNENELNPADMKRSPELNILFNRLRDGLGGDRPIYQMGFGSENNNWDVSYNSAVAF